MDNVRDNVTGLVWEVNTGESSIHDKDTTCSWHNALSALVA